MVHGSEPEVVLMVRSRANAPYATACGGQSLLVEDTVTLWGDCHVAAAQLLAMTNVWSRADTWVRIYKTNTDTDRMEWMDHTGLKNGKPLHERWGIL